MSQGDRIKSLSTPRSPRNCRAFQNFGAFGPRLASCGWKRVALLATWLATSGCLVTDPYDYPEPINEPPTLRNGTVGLKMAHILEITPDANPGVLPFSAIVEDPDIDEVLFRRVRLQWVEDGVRQNRLVSDCVRPTADEPEVPPSGSEERPLEFTIDTLQILEGTCYTLELAVSPEFEVTCEQLLDLQVWSLFDVADEPGNVAMARWYIKHTSGTGEDRVVCPSTTVGDVNL